MKNIKNILIYVLAIMFLLCLCGCKTSEENKIIGTWRTQLNCSDFIMQSITDRDPVLAQYYDIRSFVITLNYTFNSDGTYSISADSEEF